MSARPLTVSFRRVGRTCAWTALRPPRTVVPGPAMAAGGDLPHDLYTFVIEGALGTAVSANPLFAFQLEGVKAGDRLAVSWVDNKGQRGSAEGVFTAA